MKADPIRFLSVCSGLEGASLAVEPLGWMPVGFSEIEAFPSAIIAERYGSNLPGETLSGNAPPNFGDFTKIDTTKLGRVDVLMGGTPCFTAGHLVLTESGNRPIETIRVGDRVMTHKGRMRRVLAVGSKPARVGVLDGVGLGERIVCTPDHPFLSVDWVNQSTKRENKYVRIEHCSEPQWTPAEGMPGRQWCALSSYEETQESPLSCRFTIEQAMYVAGLYVGDGHVRGWSGKMKKAVVLSLNEAKYEKLVAVIGTGSHTRSEERTAIRATINDTAFADWVEKNFGRLCHVKDVPAWVMGHKHRAAFLRGFLDADGHRKGGLVSVSTTSRPLAYGIAAILNAEGYAASVSFVETPDTTVIEGRTVNQRDYWQVRAYDLASSRKARARHGYILRKATSFEIRRAKETVYDIEVEEDHSFVVNGSAVHNCQAFSVAGKRLSLDDARGNLTLAYVVLAHELARSHGLRNAIWENVKGVLNTKDNAFGCFLGAIVGHDTAFPQPRGAGWPSAGMVDGPRCRAAWRVLDAQYFGLAQRRERVFVVADFGNGADPVEVLFERQSVQGHSAPRREAGQRPSGTLSARTQGGGGLGTDFDLDGGLVAFGGGNRSGPVAQAATLTAKGQRCDFEVETFIAALRGHSDYGDGSPSLRAKGGDCAGGSEALIAHSLRAEGFDASEDGTGRGTPIVPVRTGYQGDTLITPEGIAPSLPSQGGNNGGGGGAILVQAFYSNESRCDNIPAAGISPPLKIGSNGGGQPPAIAFSIQERAVSENPSAGPDGMGVQEGVAYTLEARTVPQAVAFAQNTRDDVRLQGGDGQLVGAPAAEPGMKQTTYVAQAFDLRGREGGAQFEGPHDTANIRAASGGSSRSYVAAAVDVHPTLCAESGGPSSQDWVMRAAVDNSGPHWAVRRLTPRECERLQGAPDDYTRILWRGKPASECPDGPRYRSLGNSWAVPVVAWIARRIDAALSRSEAA